MSDFAGALLRWGQLSYCGFSAFGTMPGVINA